ncbi:uncharacterized protein MELLADRAFT_123828 [Melampsora larici-populina 98AG31]|uniref:Secreted protein n=1 Tax=Melampsora larici-populina (strain 98AG31 / pathotype 3-4-7) TaxID=747676 RepID=F4RW79_MELLP|nr:uncharacterized protein MELLADRAFT_123828 [Melampsora larici-populina 98AG31]EGG03235.1 secreted protein [Melampsora larici-populina 98AG31]
MFHQSFLKIAVLISTICFSTLIVSSLKCTGGWTQGIEGENISFATCQVGKTQDTEYNCLDNTCRNGVDRYVQMHHCLLNKSVNRKETDQKCKMYNWDATINQFSCTTFQDQVYSCNMKFDDLTPITCQTCFA